MSEKMMAAVLCGDRDIQYKETDKPTPKAGEVLVRVRASGICGSDIPRVLHKGAHFFPIILGRAIGAFPINLVREEESVAIKPWLVLLYFLQNLPCL